MEYLTYEEYEELGGILDSAAFLRNVTRANCEIDNATHCRIKDMAEVPYQAKILCRDLTELIADFAPSKRGVSSQSESAGVISESVTYSQTDRNDEIQKMIHSYLDSVDDDNGTPLLYRGCLY